MKKLHFHLPTKHLDSQRGFTLLELLLYVAISAIIMSGIVTLLILLMNSRVKNQTVTEVESQGAFIMQELGASIRNSAAITAPAAGASATSLTLDTRDDTKDPVIYSLTSGVVSVTEGSGPKPTVTPLNSSAVTVSGLSFQNLSLAGTTSQVIRVTFTVTYTNPSGRDEYNYSKTFYNSYSLR